MHIYYLRTVYTSRYYPITFSNTIKKKVAHPYGQLGDVRVDEIAAKAVSSEADVGG